jgi:hypothetical protein
MVKQQDQNIAPTINLLFTGVITEIFTVTVLLQPAGTSAGGAGPIQKVGMGQPPDNRVRNTVL